MSRLILATVLALAASSPALAQETTTPAPAQPAVAQGAPAQPATQAAPAADPAAAQPAQAAPAAPQAQAIAIPPARASDVATPEAIVTALYEVISGDKGQARDWNRFRSLMHPSGRLIASGRNPAGQTVSRVSTPEDYIRRSEPFMLAEGFHERELARRTERFGTMAHVWSTYEARHALTDEKPLVRGINSIQLFNDGSRWWVLSVYWLPESESLPLPPEYLP